MAKCNRCGMVLSTNQRICPNCGGEVIGARAQKKMFPSWAIALIIVGAFAFLVSMIAFIGFNTYSLISNVASNSQQDLFYEFIDDANAGSLVDFAMKMDIYADYSREDVEEELRDYSADIESERNACYSALTSYIYAHMTNQNQDISVIKDVGSISVNSFSEELNFENEGYIEAQAEVTIFDSFGSSINIPIDIRFVIIEEQWYVEY